ncbi:Gfo/Idh/MocA family protein [Paludisphaera soli]|uniref:Gfo/Idh/MocA family protein n=1 Tax=Paludisphaera soli TaxID=2712865 RepID=UPI0013EB0071|nr:Gfo/Idh/MocA family oxidoreductase [Paludisphaera soli]
MASEKPIRVAIIGLGFGAEFIPIYQNYPGAEMAAVCRRDPKGLEEVGEKYGIKGRYTDYRDLLKDPEIDAVHINSPIPDHAWMSIEALEAGKHVACTVPMATSIEDCKKVVDAQRSSGKVYMMMETVVYSREYLFVQELYQKGELGRLQFLRGSHQQDMDGWPEYWPGLPPMWYATHCVSPCLALLGKHAESVVCHGSGRIREDLVAKYNSPFAVESATFTIKDSDVVAEVTRSLFDTARQYRESFDATGSRKSFEWQQVEGEDPVIHTKSTAENPIAEPDIPKRVKVPDYAHLLPEGIRRFTQPAAIQDADHLSFLQGGGHGGSHPHLVHAFLSAVKGDRPALPDAETSANWTMVGLCAHESAMSRGDRIDIPTF